MYMVLAVIAVVTFVVYVVFNILFLIDMKKTGHALRVFIGRTEENLSPALSEMRLAVQEVRKVTADISVLTDKLRAAAEAVVTVEKSIEHVYAEYRRSFGLAANQNMSALKAGVVAGVASLIRNIKARKEAAP